MVHPKQHNDVFSFTSREFKLKRKLYKTHSGKLVKILNFEYHCIRFLTVFYLGFMYRFSHLQALRLRNEFIQNFAFMPFLFFFSRAPELAQRKSAIRARNFNYGVF